MLAMAQHLDDCAESFLMSALHNGALKELSALALVRKLKAYKDSYKTFPHMTSPYVYPREGLGAGLLRRV